MNLTKSEIIELENDLVVAIRKSDLAFLEKVLHDDLLFIAPNGQLITKAMDLASHRAGEMIVDELMHSFVELNLLDDSAVVVVDYNTKGTMLGNPIEGNFRYIRTWKKFPDGLKIIGGSCIKL
jgi:ketosteroid isomerase-like protein